MKINLFKLPKPREFKFTPRFYDPRKEAFEERVLRIKSEMGLVPEGESGYDTRIRKAFNRARKTKSSSKVGVFAAPKIGAMVKVFSLVLVCVVLYLLVQSVRMIFSDKSTHKQELTKEQLHERKFE
jgi:hypothetical protein